MRKLFWEFLDPTDEEKDKRWKNSVFVFDTNVLLNLYRYTDKTRTTLLQAFSSMNGRIWIPYHVGLEFMRNRCDVIFETVNKYESVNTSTAAFLDKCKTELRLKDEDIVGLKKNIEKWVAEHKKKNLLVTDPNKDPLLDEILELFDNKIGDPYNEVTLAELKAEGEKRYEKQIPPGYKDKCKDNSSKDGLLNDNNMYGDFVIWDELIKHSLKIQKGIIFVTHDQKEDWWNIVKGKTLGPRYELRKEFTCKTEQNFYMYSMNQFIELFSTYKSSVDRSVIDEIEYMNEDNKQNNFSNLMKSYIINKDLDSSSIKDYDISLLFNTLNSYQHQGLPNNELNEINKKLDELITLKNEIDEGKFRIGKLQKLLNSSEKSKNSDNVFRELTIMSRKNRMLEIRYTELKNEIIDLLE